MAEVSGGELQTLISTLQNGNTQLGHLIRATAGISPVLADVSMQLAAVARNSMQLGDVVRRTALPGEPDGYVRVNIPGVGPRLIPFYPE